MAYDADDLGDPSGDDLAPDPAPSMGTVLDEARGSLPYALLHGEALVACAAWGLGAAGVTPLDIGTPWSSVVAGGEPFVLHDSLCPMTPASFIADCVAQAVAGDVVVVGVRAVTDTVKQVEDGAVGATVDRDGVWAVCSPLVLPARVVAGLGDQGPASLSTGLDLAEMVEVLGGRESVETREAPPTARRVSSPEDVAALEALTGPSH